MSRMSCGPTQRDPLSKLRDLFPQRPAMQLSAGGPLWELPCLKRLLLSKILPPPPGQPSDNRWEVLGYAGSAPFPGGRSFEGGFS